MMIASDYEDPPHTAKCQEPSSLHIKFEPDLHVKVYNLLGKGSYGKVFSVRRFEDQKYYAMKVIDIRNDNQKHFACLEEDVGKLIRKSNTAEYLMPILSSTTQGDRVYMLMDRMETDLWKLMSEIYKCAPFHLVQVRHIAQQLLTAVNVLNDLGIIHSDIKPENILVVNSQDKFLHIKLADFGTSLRYGAYNCSAVIQSIFYRAPEILFGLPFDKKIDIWSIGCVMAELYLGFPFYPALDETQLAYYITSIQGYPFDLPTSKFWSKYFIKKRKRTANGAVEEIFYLNSSPNRVKDRRMVRIDSVPHIVYHGYTYRKAQRISCMDAQFVKDLQLLMCVDQDFRCDAEEALSLPLFHLDQEAIFENHPHSTS